MGDYWDIFVDPDIPILERIGKALLFPLAGPLAAVGFLKGCTVEPDRTLPYPPEDLLPFPDGMDVGGHHAPDTPIDTYTCVPEACEPGLLDPTRTQNGTARCLAFESTAPALGLTSAASHARASLTDIDGDGWTDIYLLNTEGPNELFLNDGGMHFAELAAAYGLDLAQQGRDAQWHDVDHDGDDDLMHVGAGGSQLYIREGDQFTPLPAEFGIVDPEPGKAAVWIGDHLLIATENGTRFYEREGDHFVERAKERGLWDSGDGAAFAVTDYDGDGDQDVYLANVTGANRLFQNQGDGTFVSIEAAAKVVQFGPFQGTDADWVRFHGEGRPSLYVTNWDAANQFYVPQADGTFVDQATPYNLRDPGNTTTSAWGDFLGEERPALFLGRWDQVNLLYLPRLDGPDDHVSDYQDIAYPMGMSVAGTTLDAHWFDYDHDGRLDLLVVMMDGVRLYRDVSRWVTTCPERREKL